MKIYHLSHTDLDGYGCQFITKTSGIDALYFNSGYGNEIDARIEEMTRAVRTDKPKEALWLITDLNLTSSQCQNIESTLHHLLAEGYKVKIQLLDHHTTGFEQSQTYTWYHLDESRCATSITFEYFKDRYTFPFNSTFENLIRHINAVDMWHDTTDEFEFGKVLMRLIMETREINKLLFTQESVEYKLSLLEKSQKFLDKFDENYSRRHIMLDNALHFMKKEFLSTGFDDALENLSSAYIVNLIGKKKESMSITFKGKKGLLTSQIGNASVIGNAILKAYPEFDFFMDYSGKGNVSLRADGKMDVAAMAKTVFGGGGHKNASGGRLQGGKDFFIYSDLRSYLQNILEQY